MRRPTIPNRAGMPDTYGNRNIEAEKTRMFIDRLKGMQPAQPGGPVVYESDYQYDLTYGQVKMLQDRKITLIMSDDLGKYVLVLGERRAVTKEYL